MSNRRKSKWLSQRPGALRALAREIEIAWDAHGGHIGTIQVRPELFEDLYNDEFSKATSPNGNTFRFYVTITDEIAIWHADSERTIGRIARPK